MTNESGFDVRVRCTFCESVYVVTVPIEGYRRWVNGTLIQEAMPDVSVADRELLISNICDDCFPKDEEDDR